MIDEINKKKWQKIKDFIANNFLDGEEPDLDAILFLIGHREVGQNKKNYKKDEKLDILHVAICRVLMPYGYYQLLSLDNEGWPHFELTEELPNLKPGEQSLLMKEAIIRYFEEESIIDY